MAPKTFDPKSKLPGLPALPGLAKIAPSVGGPLAAPPKLPSLKQMAEAGVNPLDVNIPLYAEDNNAEHDMALDMATLEDEFKTIHDARKGQEEAIELANDSEFWCCFYFQSRAQSEAFTNAIGVSSDKYVDGLEAARLLGIELPPRVGRYKVGKIDKKLSDLT